MEIEYWIISSLILNLYLFWHQPENDKYINKEKNIATFIYMRVSK